MGSNLSTLAFGAMENMSRETMIGVLLSIPFFVQYFKQHMEAFKKDPTQIVSTLKTMSTLQYTVEESETAVVKHRSLMCGSIPEIPPSSEDSVSTIRVSNHKRDAPLFPVATFVPAEVLLEPLPLDPLEIDEPTMEDVPVLSIETLMPERTHMPAPVLPLAEDEPTRNVPSEKKHLFDVTPRSKPPMESITVLTPETFPVEASECGLDTSDGSQSETSETKTTSEYLESVSRSLLRRARKSSHSDKVGIAHALVELGDILLKDDAYKSAMSVYKRAELLQKVIIDETLTSVVSALAQQSQYHKKCGNMSFAKIYGNMSEELQARPTPINLQKCIKLHYKYKPHGHVDKEWASINKKLDRRLRRAGAEAVPLVATLKKQATCASSR